ncbi:uncharacterized protein NP_6008A (plasmid) [Natronomonas pharaonis DSM 2160]|uniref:Uncharacterized protein n=1 Tax=Natronomonas pharaonis (strain ATCC 35678 / DSM 2160 / CIP 103997 / JCM 8858 / NBRC 14720 / NCIMB 2260 / Gabara) TaxID=348780 RepID=Q3IM75_NATPD|nr:hypothetical protein [Natronomonas pharaonis]CAI50784.1 uncharacterized protein NP_6008A [Natronomonas pharaonis DSM 2160]
MISIQPLRSFRPVVVTSSNDGIAIPTKIILGAVVMPMESGDSFRVVIKKSALEANDAARRLCDKEGDCVAFDSEKEAEEMAAELTRDATGEIKIQQAAPNDPADVDAYLVHFPKQRKRTPDGSLQKGWTFDTTANQYGAIGETLITAPGTPAVKHFVKQDLGPLPSDEVGSRIRTEVKTDKEEFDWETLRSAVANDWINWTPDCEIRVLIGYPPAQVHQYFCEIKSGDASFERNQQGAMDAASKNVDVLKIRVTLEGLPNEYSVKFRRVGDSSPDVNWENLLERVTPFCRDQTDLSDFY